MFQKSIHSSILDFFIYESSLWLLSFGFQHLVYGLASLRRSPFIYSNTIKLWPAFYSLLNLLPGRSLQEASEKGCAVPFDTSKQQN